MLNLSSILKRSKLSGGIVPLVGAVALLAPTISYGGFLFTGISEGGREEFIAPKINYDNTVGRYSEWDSFYSRYSVGNLPDVWAKFGGGSEERQDDDGEWYTVKWPTARPLDNPDFPYSVYYNSYQPNAFWDVNNPTITQNGTASALLTGGGNIYSWTDKLSFKLEDNTTQGADAFVPSLVVFQFQTDGALVDFANIKLIYKFESGETGEVLASNLNYTDYLREYQPSAGSPTTEQFTGNGYRNRVAIQWDLSQFTDGSGNPVTSYSIEWAAQSPSMSLQQVALDTSDTFERSLPSHRAWLGGDGEWSNGGNWFQYGQGGGFGITPDQNGNVIFENGENATVVLSGSHTAGELIFTSSNNVTINATNDAKLTSNTGISTSATASGTYTINAGYVLGSLNLMEINGGSVVLGGVVSGNHGLVKSGEGTLVLAANNTFTGSILLDNGTLRISGSNQYSAGTTLLNGKLVVAANASIGSGALGTNSDPISVGADAALYKHIQRDWDAEFQIDGAFEVQHDILLAAGDNKKTLSAINTGTGATFSGAIHFTNPSADPSATDSAAGNVFLKATGVNDVLIFSGGMDGGVSQKTVLQGTNSVIVPVTVTLNGLGSVVYTGGEKSYDNATVVQSGRLVLDHETALTGSGSLTVSGSSTLRVDGYLSGAGSLLLQDGARVVGSGTINRAFTVENGTVLAPGNSPGTLTTVDQTWGSGGVLAWEINNATGGEGVSWDYLDIQGSLTITATTDERFVLQLNSLTLANIAGDVANFDGGFEGGYRWLIASTTEGVDWSEVGNFGDYFTFDTTGFSGLEYGQFGLELFNDNQIFLTYNAIPEPSTWILIGIAAAGGIVQAARRGRNSGFNGRN